MTQTEPYCPACDVRAIGLPDDGAHHEVVIVTSPPNVGPWTIAQCKACGCAFNTGTTRAFGGAMTPLSYDAFRNMVHDAMCVCGPEARGTAVDVNYLDERGVEQRAHGWVHRQCKRWVQVG